MVFRSLGRFVVGTIEHTLDIADELVTGGIEIIEGVVDGKLDASDVIKKSVGHISAATINAVSPSWFISLAIENTPESHRGAIFQFTELLYSQSDDEIEKLGIVLKKSDIDLAFWILYTLQKFSQRPIPNIEEYHAKGYLSFENFRHYLRHANAAYGILMMQSATYSIGATREDLIAEELGFDVDNILACGHHDRAKDLPGYYLCVDKGREEVVLVIRGTFSLRDVKTDLDCGYLELHGSPYKYHGGMLKTALALYNHLMGDIKNALASNPGYKFVTCGHSLGGGVAAIMVILLSKEKADGQFVTSAEIVEGREIHCYALEPAASMCIDAAVKYHNIISSVVNDNDIVPSLSYGTLLDLKKYAVYLKRNRDALGKILLTSGRMLGGFGESQTANTYLETFRALADSKKLVPPGKVFALDGCSESPRFGRVVDVVKHFKEPRFILGMVLDHTPDIVEHTMNLFK